MVTFEENLENTESLQRRCKGLCVASNNLEEESEEVMPRNGPGWHWTLCLLPVLSVQDHPSVSTDRPAV